MCVTLIGYRDKAVRIYKYTRTVVGKKINRNYYESNKQDALYTLIYYSKPALHVSGDVFAHHQEHLTVYTVSGSVHPSCCQLVSWMS
jgi:hypothetical protein